MMISKRTKICIAWLWNSSGGIRLRILLSSILGVGYVGASLAFVSVSKSLIDIATLKAEGVLWHYAALLAVCILVQLFCSTASSRLDMLNAVWLKCTLRHRLFARMMESKLRETSEPHTGEVLNRMEEDTRIVSEGLCATLPSVLVSVVQLIATFYFLLVLEPLLAWMIVGIIPLAVLLSKVYFKRMRRLTGEIRSVEGRIQSHVQEHLQHRTLIRCLERTMHAIVALTELQTTLWSQAKRRTDFTLFSRTFVQLGFAAGYAIAFLWSVQGLLEGTVTFGMMTAFLQLVAQVQRPVVELSRYFPSFVHSLLSAERLEELDVWPVEEQGNPIFLPAAVGIRLKGVSFSYAASQRKIFDSFTCDFAPGRMTMLVGETGAGKSTLIKLMLALFTPQQGCVTFYNETTEVIASPLTRCNLVYVPQGNSLLSGTVRENLLQGNPHATEAELRDVLYTAVAEFVFDLRDALETHVGEGGVGLSEGQTQRLAIARGLLRPGGILLLDEPTSSLDAYTESILLKRLAARVVDKTVILVTHTHQTVIGCDTTIKIKRSQ